MLTYEVNISVINSIAADYYPWLLQHVQQMLQFDGFISANVSVALNDSIDTTDYIVHYHVDNERALNDYFSNHAAIMRADAVEKFGSNFTATRRVLKHLQLFKETSC